MFRHSRLVHQIGSTYALLLPKKPEDDAYRNVTLEFHDFQSNLPLWSRFFKRLPMMGWNPAEDIIVLAWELTEPGAKDEIRQDPEAARLVESIPQRDESYFIVALETHTGKPVARFPINTGKGSYHIVDIHPSGEYLVFQDNHDRLLVYNLIGQRIGRFFGKNPAISSKTGMLAVEREPGRMALARIIHEGSNQGGADGHGYKARDGGIPRCARKYAEESDQAQRGGHSGFCRRSRSFMNNAR